MSIENIKIPKDFNPDLFEETDYTNVSYDNQLLFFNLIREEFAIINKNEDSLPRTEFIKLNAQKITDIIEMSAGGNVAAQDYLCYLYKRGLGDMMPPNLVRAHEWGLIAISNGSKLSIDRLRLFFEPVFEFVVQSGKVNDIVDKNEIKSDEVAEYVAKNYSILFLQAMDINLLDTARKPLVEEQNLVKFTRDSEKTREKLLNRMLELIA